MSKQPSDFYFCIGNDGLEYADTSENYFLITSKAYFDKTHCLDDRSGQPDRLLPDGFYELSESMYEYDGIDVQEGRNLLLIAGFIENPELLKAGQ
jgi:hypothetical protein